VAPKTQKVSFGADAAIAREILTLLCDVYGSSDAAELKTKAR
jgi:hypothetical protein